MDPTKTPVEPISRFPTPLFSAKGSGTLPVKHLVQNFTITTVNKECTGRNLIPSIIINPMSIMAPLRSAELWVSNTFPITSADLIIITLITILTM
mmetsp:Transcript_12066/g.25475  ORF Transcript_12066/g.25475 Transcript_12066/m.25475 type:complete len:95 (+) Transcript_12066:2441-2725(+)